MNPIGAECAHPARVDLYAAPTHAPLSPSHAARISLPTALHVNDTGTHPKNLEQQPLETSAWDPAPDAAARGLNQDASSVQPPKPGNWQIPNAPQGVANAECPLKPT